jgi:hypothetical protein
MADSSDIDAALIALLQADATLTGLLPDGVHMDQAPPNKRKFGIVSLVFGEDRSVFAERAIEDCVFLVKAVVMMTDGANAKAAAARIDVLLESTPLAAAGYTWMTTERLERVRYTEVDSIDATIRWQHRGGRYRVQMSTT